MKPSPAQIKKIHALKGALRMDDCDYRDMLSGYGVSSSKDPGFTFDQARELIDRMETSAISSGSWQHKQAGRPGKSRYEGLGDRPGMATPKQLRYIEALWNGVTVMQTAADKKKALNHFITNRFAVERIEWLPRETVSKVIRALTVMARQAKRAALPRMNCTVINGINGTTPQNLNTEKEIVNGTN